MMEVLLCDPTYFSVIEKDPDNRYMDPAEQPDPKRASVQHAHLVATYQRLGVKVLKIPAQRDASDMVFTANPSFTLTTSDRGKIAILARFKPPRRKVETAYHKTFFKAHGYRTYEISETFEGAGDAILYRAPGKTPKILLGYGFRTSLKAASALEKITGLEVVPLKLRHPRDPQKKIPYHFDTTGIVFEKEETFILYRDALTKQALKRLEALGEIVDASYEDFENLALNAVVIPKEEIEDDGALERLSWVHKDFKGVVITSDFASAGLLKDIWKKTRYITHPLNLSEFKKSGGGAFCLTKIL